MADQKLTALTENTTPALTDNIYLVDDPAGSPVSQKITVANLLSLLHPVGSIYTSTDSTNPGTSLGFGTWSAFGAGKVLVGLDSGDTDFNTSEETGGAKTSSIAHTHTGPSHQHLSPLGGYAIVGDRVINYGQSGATETGSANITVTSSASSNITAMKTKAEGTGATGAMSANATPSVVQPYIVVYMWKRTA